VPVGIAFVEQHPNESGGLIDAGRGAGNELRKLDAQPAGILHEAIGDGPGEIGDGDAFILSFLDSLVLDVGEVEQALDVET